ncbi:MAG: tRNA (adenosine(37)-N6)-dimethylallyltransferase MiaA [Candidatus Saccharimonadales bacterium]
MATSNKLVVIVGTTASGKSAAAMQIAQERGGEIICADSRTVYKGMDIGTAKPSAEDQKLVPHHLLDVVSPDQSFTAADFQKLANKAIKDIQKRGKLPILVGGTGLYVDSVIYNFSFRPVDTKKRAQLEELSVKQLQTKIVELGLDLPANDQNPRHLIRTLETNGTKSKKQPMRANTLVLGIDVPSDVLKERISKRVEQMIEKGLETEVSGLVDRYGWHAEAMKGIGYREWQGYFEGKQGLEATKELIVKNSWQYARRQRTWFRRNKDIHWQSY